MDLKRIENREVVICVVGLGFVGFPLALEFAKNGFEVIGYDIDEDKVKKINNLEYSCDEIEKSEIDAIIKNSKIVFTTDPSLISRADFVIICVPTLLNERKEPDLRHIINAGRTVGKYMKKGCYVVLESSVYPGVTEDVLKPVLEEESGLKCGSDFKIGYSPERSSPGIKEHNLRTIVKVVSGIDEETVINLEGLYKTVAKAGVYKAKNIKTAEAAKLLENIQRDINIAMVNEMSKICKAIGIDVYDVIETAGTKFNFYKYYPGLVGGYCVPVNPCYMTFKARQHGIEPELMLTARKVNESMPKYVCKIVENALNDVGKSISESKILIIGLTFKKNVSDPRESPSKEVIDILVSNGCSVFGYDPLVGSEKIRKFFNIEPIEDLQHLSDIDCILVLMDHDVFKNISVNDLKTVVNEKPVIVDTKRLFNKSKMNKEGFVYIGF
ncbi:MAG: nucleotide sugar dehydrogenase [Candidatus Aenigmatarchaeota archaeon]|nr:MAG: nucleotide sugar dehydrogenase [Candidatus Aenigmarchaeota archaeon]